MRKKVIRILTVFVVLFHIFGVNVLYVEAKEQPDVCNSPSELMSDYFSFQNEAMKILLGSELNEKRFSVSFNGGWLFSDKILSLRTGENSTNEKSAKDNVKDTAIDLLASTVGTLESAASNLITSAVLLLLVSSSVLESNAEGLAILFKDRPIVRDYKKMLDIESSLFDIAFFLSKKVNLTHSLEGDLSKNFNELLEKYQDKGLLETGFRLKENESSIADILSDLLAMNASMKYFVAVGGGDGIGAFIDYNGCLGIQKAENCQRAYAIIKFSEEAIKQLDQDYKDVRLFSACNNYANFFRNSMEKTVNNNIEAVKNSFGEVKESIKRLKGALYANKGAWNFKNKRQNLCNGISDYEMAQLRAYWGPNRSCGGIVNSQVDISDLTDIYKEYKEKKQQREQKEKMKTVGENMAGGSSQTTNPADQLGSKSLTTEKNVEWLQIFGTSTTYNSKFSNELNSALIEVLDETMEQYSQAQENAIAADISDLFPLGKGILDQIETATLKVNELEKVLNKIKNKQCSS